MKGIVQGDLVVIKDDHGWKAVSRFAERALVRGSKREVVAVAKRFAAANGGTLVVYKSDGSIQEQRTYSKKASTVAQPAPG